MRKPLVASVLLHAVVVGLVALTLPSTMYDLDVRPPSTVAVVSAEDVPDVTTRQAVEPADPAPAPAGEAEAETPADEPEIPATGEAEDAAPPREVPEPVPAAPPTSEQVAAVRPPAAKPPAPGKADAPGAGPAETAADAGSTPAAESAAEPEPEPLAEEPADDPPEPVPAEGEAEAPVEEAPPARTPPGGGTETASTATDSPPLIDFSPPPSPPSDAVAEDAPDAEAADAEFASLLERMTDPAEPGGAAASPNDETAESAPRDLDELIAEVDPDTPRSAADAAAPVTAGEIDALRRQIEACWNIPAGVRDAGDLVVQVRVMMNRDGTPSHVDVVDGQARNGTWRAAADSARRAVLNPRCHPFRLPPEKFDAWQHLVLTFNPKELLSR